MKIKRGDFVRVITGKDRGKSGKIIKLLPKSDKVVLDGLNLYKKHVRPKRQGEKGELVRVPRPMAISNVMLICASCKKAVRSGWRIENENKKRICKKCQAGL